MQRHSRSQTSRVVAAAEADNRQTVAEAQASLAWKLIERAPPGADAMVSPASLASAFSALSVGADDRMKAAMFKAVGFDAAP